MTNRQCSDLMPFDAEKEKMRSEIERLTGRMTAKTAVISELTAERDKLRAALEQIGWMDEFLNADGARAMMNIARKAINQSSNEQ